MKKELIIAAGISGAVLVSFIACNNNNTPATTDNNKDTAKAIQQVTPPTNNDSDALPNLLEIGATIKNAGVKYIPGLTNPVSDASQYNTAFDREINLGIYFADLSYCTLNKQNQKSTEYLKAVKTIADGIGIGQLFGSGTFFQRYQSNLNNEDSLTAIVADIQERADNLAKGNLQSIMRVVIYSGAWIENVYIGEKVNSQVKSSSAGLQIIEQMTMLDNILKTLGNYQNADQHLQDLYTDLKQIANAYHSYDEVKNYNPDSKQEFALTDEHSKGVTQLLQGLHSKYIK